jgi:NADH pyrophosphatase NudC (nudix superfamily)
MTQCAKCGQKDCREWVFCPICGGSKKSLIDEHGVGASFIRVLVYYVIAPIVLLLALSLAGPLYLGCVRMLLVCNV